MLTSIHMTIPMKNSYLLMVQIMRDKLQKILINKESEDQFNLDHYMKARLIITVNVDTEERLNLMVTTILEHLNMDPIEVKEHYMIRMEMFLKKEIGDE